MIHLVYSKDSLHTTLFGGDLVKSFLSYLWLIVFVDMSAGKREWENTVTTDKDSSKQYTA